uniref:Uncharacterized protein n=1 Tax=Nelumbo nucifera TaxID=4432 RepID=A0A822Y2D6_NELNU|nr:TPA_asm: hypothetical protein HUJ06_027591 [Nelumbo nucifera]
MLNLLCLLKLKYVEIMRDDIVDFGKSETDREREEAERERTRENWISLPENHATEINVVELQRVSVYFSSSPSSVR